jgi:hypothetical protein
MCFEKKKTINSYCYVWLILTPLFEEVIAIYKNVIKVKVDPRTGHECPVGE